MLKVSLVYEIDGWRHVAGRVNYLPSKAEGIAASKKNPPGSPLNLRNALQ